MAGYTVVDPATVITTHIKETIKRNAQELLGRQEVQTLLDKFKETNPKVVEELVPNLMTLGKVQKVLQNLLREQISIRDLRTILESLADFAAKVEDPGCVDRIRSAGSGAADYQKIYSEGRVAFGDDSGSECGGTDPSIDPENRIELLSGIGADGCRKNPRQDPGRGGGGYTNAGDGAGTPGISFGCGCICGNSPNGFCRTW